MNNKDREIKVLRDALNSIIMIGFDYDGYENSLEGCKSLIDEFVSIADNALNKKQSTTYLTRDKDGKGVIVNVFDEVVGTYNPHSTKDWEINYFDNDREDY